MERTRREKKSKVDISALNALSNAKRGVVSRKDQVQVHGTTSLRFPILPQSKLSQPQETHRKSHRMNNMNTSCSGSLRGPAKCLLQIH